MKNAATGGVSINVTGSFAHGRNKSRRHSAVLFAWNATKLSRFVFVRRWLYGDKVLEERKQKGQSLHCQNSIQIVLLCNNNLWSNFPAYIHGQKRQRHNTKLFRQETTERKRLLNGRWFCLQTSTEQEAGFREGALWKSSKTGTLQQT